MIFHKKKEEMKKRGNEKMSEMKKEKTSTASGTSMRLDCVKDILDILGLMDIPDWD